MRDLAATQDGVVGIDQLPTIDCDAHHWWRARRSRGWDALSRRVLRLRGSPPTDRQRVLAGVLDAGGGAVLHHPSALSWFGLSGFDLSTVHVTRTRGTTNRPCDLAQVHRLRAVRPHDLTTVHGVPTVTALRAIWAEAARFSSPHRYERGLVRLARLLDDAHNKHLLTWAALHDSLDGLQRCGRAGTRLMRELAVDRQPGSSPTESRNEDRFEELLEGAGRRPLERQVVVGGREVIGRADFRDGDLPLVGEVNSLEFHTSPSDRAADQRRYQALVASGFVVAVVWTPDLWSNTASVLATVDEARCLALAGTPCVLHTASCPWPFDPTRRVIGRRPDNPRA